jgi:hypothetical protein
MADEKDNIELELDDSFEIEIEDDTPEEDRGKDPMPKEIVEKLEDDELEEFSKEKAKQYKKVWHDERRRAEAALREREEAVNVAKQLYEENRKLKKNLNTGEKVFVGTAKASAERELEFAKREYKEAYDSGDSDRVVEAQEKLVAAKLKIQQVESYRPQYEEDDETSLQPAKKGVNKESEGQWSAAPSENAAPSIDPKAVAWQKRNAWFGENRVMTSMAFGLHENLVSKGVDPKSDEYYEAIDKEMRRRFPEEFEDTDEAPKKGGKKPATVVAPAQRATGPQKVVLTVTQVALAKKLGLTPAQYAAELIKMGDINV